MAAKSNRYSKTFLTREKKKFLDERLEAIKNGRAAFVSLAEIKERFHALKKGI